MGRNFFELWQYKYSETLKYGKDRQFMRENKGTLSMHRLALKCYKTIFLIFFNLYNTDLLKEPLNIHFSPLDLELWVPKVCTGWLNLDCLKSSDSLHKLTKNVASNPKGLKIFLTTNFDGP